MRPKLSVCVITRDEEERLGRCLASVAGLAGEILVVDSGSTDATRSVAESHGARWLERVPFPGYPEQKQWAMERCAGEWILSLDADEWLEASAADRIRRAVDGATATRYRGAAEGDVDGYRLIRRIRYLGRQLRGGNAARESKIRLVRAGRGRWTGGSPHERLEVPGKVERLGAVIRHEPHRSVTEHLETVDLYSRMLAPRLARRSRLRLVLGMTLEPLLVLVKELVLLGGLVDGSRGLLHAALTALDFHLRHARAWELRAGRDSGAEGLAPVDDEDLAADRTGEVAEEEADDPGS